MTGPDFTQPKEDCSHDFNDDPECMMCGTLASEVEHEYMKEIDAWQRRALLAESRVAPLLDQQSSILASVVTLANVVGVETVIGESIAGLVERVAETSASDLASLIGQVRDYNEACNEAQTDVSRMHERVDAAERDCEEMRDERDHWRHSHESCVAELIAVHADLDAAVKRAEEARAEADTLRIDLATAGSLGSGVLCASPDPACPTRQCALPVGHAGTHQRGNIQWQTARELAESKTPKGSG
jgi:hypothetical protein